MKYFITALALLFSITAQADNYVRASLGSADISAQIGPVAVDDSTSYTELTYGVGLTDNLAVEASYIDSGNVSASSGGYNAKAQAKGYAVMAAFNQDMGRFTYGVRGGMFFWDTSASVVSSGGGSASADGSGSDLIYGVNAGYKITDNVTLRGDYTMSDVDIADVKVISFGLQIGF